MASSGKGAANDAAVDTSEPPAPGGASEADRLAQLADEAEAAAAGALAKVDKQQGHLADAERAAKELQAVAVKARRAADKAQQSEE
jgi:hypothetical protein